MKTPFFSIIIPTYNRAHTIQRPIDSIISQTFTSWELIIIDDGSTDDTKDVVDAYKDIRIRYVWQKNQERSAARNHGIRLAGGEWICFQDSDDEYLPEHLYILYQGIRENPEFKIVRTGLVTVFPDGQKIYSPAEKNDKFDYFPCSCFTSAAFHKSILRKDSFNVKFTIAEDAAFLLNLYEVYDIKVIGKHSVVYNLDLNYKINLKTQLEKYNVYRSILPGNQKLISAVKMQICIISISILYHALKEKKQQLTSIALNVRSIVLYPLFYFYAIKYFIDIRLLKNIKESQHN